MVEVFENDVQQCLAVLKKRWGYPLSDRYHLGAGLRCYERRSRTAHLQH